jgi:hypothetical protein
MYEFIEFESSVDVWQVDASINSTKVAQRWALRRNSHRVRRQDLQRPFRASGERGNKGRTGSKQRDFWTRINVPEILHLEPPRRSTVVVTAPSPK